MKESPPHIKSFDAVEESRIYLLPNLFTAGNLFFGFLAIIRCIQAKYSSDDNFVAHQFYNQAVWFIIASFFCDAFDGRIARLGNKESLFGKEFDSIADMVSFGLAPALMVFFIILSPTEQFPFFRQVGWLIGFIYLLCAGIRLARFNVLTNPMLSEQIQRDNLKSFVGLPVPAAAGVIASLVLVINTVEDLKNWALALPLLMLLIAWLMISEIPYPSFKRFDWNTRLKFTTFVIGIAAVIIISLFHEFAFAIAFLSYIFYGLFKKIRLRLKK